VTRQAGEAQAAGHQGWATAGPLQVLDRIDGYVRPRGGQVQTPGLRMPVDDFVAEAAGEEPALVQLLASAARSWRGAVEQLGGCLNPIRTQVVGSSVRLATFGQETAGWLPPASPGCGRPAQQGE